MWTDQFSTILTPNRSIVAKVAAVPTLCHHIPTLELRIHRGMTPACVVFTSGISSNPGSTNPKCSQVFFMTQPQDIIRDDEIGKPGADETTPSGYVRDIRTIGCGFLMGAADVVPGVSGGTVALILGIYERLINAISNCNRTFVSLLLSRRWTAAAHHLDLRFVLALGIGIATGIGGLATLMKYLLTEHRSLTFAAFSGMILASSWIVARRIRSFGPHHLGLILLGALIALRLVSLTALQNPPDSLWYLFFCGMIGITAMILPGISGAFILLLLGRYDYILACIRSTVHGDITLPTLMSLTVFAVGCITGLLSFSRILHWLLAEYEDATMAVLCGFMLGSLYKLWPFQRETSISATDLKHRTYANYLPESLSDAYLVILVFVVSSALVLALDFTGNWKRKSAQLTSRVK